MRSNLIIGLAAVTGLLVIRPTPVAAQLQQEQDRKSMARAAAVEQRRVWLRDQLRRELPDPTKVAALAAWLDEQSADEIDRLSSEYLTRLKGQDTTALHRQLRAAVPPQGMSSPPPQPLAAAKPVVVAPGFFPIITWLPAGTSLTTSAVVTPHGHVRVTAWPFFSSFGPLQTFNFFTGQTHGIHLHHSHHHHHHHHPHPLHHLHGGRHLHGAPSHRAETWYDGLRTRVGPRPRGRR